MKKLLLLLLLISASGCLLQAPKEETTKYVLDNGITVIAKENHANRIVAAKLLVKSGAWSEAPSEMGIRNFVQELLLKGTAKRTAEDIAFETDSKGILLSTDVADDYLAITMVSTSEFFDDGMEILSDITMNPSFPGEEIEAERERIMEAIKAQDDDQFTSVRLLFQKELYGDHPYGNNPLGTWATLQEIDREALLKYHMEHYAPNNIVIAVVGDIEAGKARDIVEEKFRGFKPREIPEKPKLEVRGESRNASLAKEREQSFILMGFRTAPISSGDYPALKVLSSLLGGGSSSRLYVDLRGERGLAYAVGSFYPSRVEDSYLAAYIGTAPANEDEVVELIMREFEDLKSKPVSEEELAVAKKSIVGDFELDHESNERQAFYLAWYEAIGMGYGYDARYPVELERVTATDVQRVAQKYFEKPVIARVGPAGVVG